MWLIAYLIFIVLLGWLTALFFKNSRIRTRNLLFRTINFLTSIVTGLVLSILILFPIVAIWIDLNDCWKHKCCSKNEYYDDQRGKCWDECMFYDEKGECTMYE